MIVIGQLKYELCFTSAATPSVWVRDGALHLAMGGSDEESDSLHDDLADFPLPPEGLDDLEDLDDISEAEAEAPGDPEDPDDPDDPEDAEDAEAHEAGDAAASADIEIPEHPTRTGVNCAEYFARGLPREGLEPVSVMPGRSQAVARDIGKIVQGFKDGSLLCKLT